MQLFKNIAGRINTPTLHCVPGENYAALDGDVLSRGQSLNSQRNAFAVRAYSRAVERACERGTTRYSTSRSPDRMPPTGRRTNAATRGGKSSAAVAESAISSSGFTFSGLIPEPEYPDAADVPIAVSRPARRNLRQRGFFFGRNEVKNRSGGESCNEHARSTGTRPGTELKASSTHALAGR
jgi:hypothetical protein